MDNSIEDIYDVNKYTEKELFDILDLSEPSDRELEAKIISLYKRYENIQNNSGNQLAKFFKDIYERFFDITDEKEHEDPYKENFNYEIEEGFENIIEGVENIEEKPEAKPEAKPEPEKKQSDTTYTTQLTYTKDKLNPLLTQTIKRVVSIDSQYRDDKTNMSTEFTFNLSETLKDVVSLKLYSVQIPHTWYTVSTNYGCNFFYLKGKSPGINDGTFDYKIEIPAGNYTAGNLITTLNSSITTVANENPDISFGNTSINYNPDTAVATFNISMNKQYNETSYFLNFPNWSSPNSNESSTNPSINTRFQTIPGFLGYNYSNYYTDVLYSLPTLPLTTNIGEARNDVLQGLYHVDSSNNYFTVIKYIGPDEYTSKSIIDLSFNIVLSNLNGIVSRSQLVNELNVELENNDYLVDSEILRIDISNTSLINTGNSLYELNIKFNRNTTNNIDNSKTLIIFPTELTNTGYNNIWTGSTSCFRFKNTINEINNIISETSTVEQQSGRFKIKNNPYIYLKCIKPGYSVIENDYKISLLNSQSEGYTLSQYVNVINNAMIVTNQKTINTKNIAGDFNLTNQYAYIDENSTFNINLDLNRNFTQDMYYLDLSNSILLSILNLSGQYLTGIPNLQGARLQDSSLNTYTYLNKIDTSYSFINNDSVVYTFNDEYNILFNNTNKYSNYSKDAHDIEIYNTLNFIDIITDKEYNFKIVNPFDLTTSTIVDSSGILYTYVDSSNSIYESLNMFINYNYRDTYGHIFTYLDSRELIKNYLDNFIFPFQDINGNIVKLSNLLGVNYDYYDLSGSSNINYTFTSSFIENTKYVIDNSYILVASPSKLNYGNQLSPPFKIETTDMKPYYTKYQDLEADINRIINNYVDNFGVKIFYGSNLTITPNIVTRNLDCTFTILMKKTITQLDYNIYFYDVSYNSSNGYNKFDATWYDYLKLDESLLYKNDGISFGKPISIYDEGKTSWTTIKGIIPIPVNTITFTDDLNNIFYMIPYERGVKSNYKDNDLDKEQNKIVFKIPAIASDKKTQIKYTRDTLITTLNKLISSNPITKGSSIKLITINNINYTQIRININKKYTAVDYNLVFYDQISFSSCYSGVKSITNTTWDTTLGWLIGFHNETVYNLSNYGKAEQVIIINGDTTVSVNLYNYFLICLDDFTQNHLNDGLVTLASSSSSIALPTYANKSNYTCDPATGLLTYNISSTNSKSYNKLTQKQIYSLTEIANSKRKSSIISSSDNTNSKSYGSGPFVKDVFGYIPIKPGVDNGSVCVWDGGTLQNQERGYFGPVNINKMSVHLVSDRGDTINLNGSNWSFSLVIEQLYQKKPTTEST
jgi:hypothetical protein